MRLCLSLLYLLLHVQLQGQLQTYEGINRRRIYNMLYIPIKIIGVNIVVDFLLLLPEAKGTSVNKKQTNSAKVDRLI